MTGRPAHRPNRWPAAYARARRIDNLGGNLGATLVVLAAVTARYVRSELLVWRENRSARWAARIQRELDRARIGEDQ